MRVLIVEDDPLLGEALAAGLKQRGFEVDWVQDGREAQTAIGIEPFAAVVLDLGSTCTAARCGSIRARRVLACKSRWHSRACGTSTRHRRVRYMTGGPMLFSERSIWTMVHGIGLGGAALLGLAAALFYLYAARPAPSSAGVDTGFRAFAVVTVATAVMLWLTVIIGTYIIFPPYRAAPPPGTTDLSTFPRALVLASPDTAWLHAFAMEIKEHMPWIASMLTTAVAFIAVRYRAATSNDSSLRRMAVTLLAISFAIVAFVSLLGVFVNKVAPLD